MRPDASKTTVPFLVDFAVVRTERPDIEGRYSEDLHVWTIDTPHGRTPIVEARTPMLETLTKTAVRQEVDDDDPGGAILSEFITKTDVRQEADDASYAADLLELETKTEAELEHDDQSRPVV